MSQEIDESCSTTYSRGASGARDEVVHEAPSDLTIEEFISNHPNASVRLRNGIRMAADAGMLPFATITEYMSAGPLRLEKMLKLQNLGRKSVAELDNLILTGNFEPPPSPPKEIEPPELGSEFDISLFEFLQRQPNVSLRLKNALRFATHEGVCPYATVKDYVRAGSDAIVQLRRIPNLGRGSAQEFDALVQAAIVANSIEPLAVQCCMKASGFPDLETLVEGICSSLPERELDVILDRVKSKLTLEEVATHLGITRERVRQIETKGLDRITQGFGRALQDAAKATVRWLTDHGVKECSLQEFSALSECDAITAELFLGLIKKMQLPQATQLELTATHVLCSNEFLPACEWNKAIKEALLAAHWPIDIPAFLDSLPGVPGYYIVQLLCESYGATIEDEKFITPPKLTKAEMCIYALRAAGRPLHCSEIRAAVFRLFDEDMSEHYVNATVGRLPTVAITAPGTYGHYSTLPYSDHQISEIRNSVYAYLIEKGVFLSSKVLFDRLFAHHISSYPEGFNHYIVMGFVQDDDRFITKRGNMVGLMSFDLSKTFMPLEDEVRNLVIEYGPITIPEILEKLSETRKLCNDVGIRQILTSTPSIIQVGRRTYDSLHRFFETREEYDNLVLALKVSLLAGPKGVYSLTDEMSALGLHKISFEVVESVLTSIDGIAKSGNAYRIEQLDEDFEEYQKLATQCLAQGGREELEHRVSQHLNPLLAQRMAKYDSRFSDSQRSTSDNAGHSELTSILDEFDF